MRRREILKGLSMMAAGAALQGRVEPLFAQQGQELPRPLAIPIRGLVKKNGALQQPVQISIPQCAAGQTVITRIDGEEVDRRVLAESIDSFAVYLSPVSSMREAKVAVSIGREERTANIQIKPVRQVLIYILNHSHHDLGYTDIQPNIEEKQMNNIALAMQLAEKTAQYPEGARFVWNLEVLWSAEFFMRRRSKREQDAFIEAVRNGSVHLNGMYANELTGLCRPEELLRLFQYSHTLGRQCGVTVDSAMLSDVPGYTWGTIMAMAQSGIRYFSAAPNNADRIGTLRPTCHDKPFWHISPSGKERVLVWMPGHGYASWPQGDATMAAGCQDFLDSVNFPYGISYMRWSGHGDNALPDPQICEFVKIWNQEYEWPKFALASTSTAFADFEQKYGKGLPELKGDLTPYWEDGAGSSALETRINRNASDRIAQAEALSAMLKRPIAPGDLDDAWRNILLYSEHTWGASASVREPDGPMTRNQWAIKRQFALDGEKQSRHLLEAVLRPVETGGVEAIDIFNATSWPRTEVVYLSKELSAAGDHVKDDHGNPVPSQRLSTGKLALLASAVPPFGCTRFHISKGKAHLPPSPVTVRNASTLDNGILSARIDPHTGNLIELTREGKPENLIDNSSDSSANEYLFVTGRDFAEVWKMQQEALGIQYQDIALDGSDIGSIQKSGPAQVTVEEAGLLVASLRVDSSAPGCDSLVRRVRLTAGADWLELSNTVDKKPAPENPYFSDKATHGAWAQYGGKEAVHFGFPFAVPGGQLRMDIPLAEMRPELDQLPGACKNWLPVGRWIDIANEAAGVTWVTLDTPLVEIGELSATLVGSNHNPVLWRQQIGPTQKFYSWAMNNHWETNYCASQQGPVEFRYALRAHSGYDPAAASRLSIGLSQPLVATQASSNPPAQSLLRVEPEDVLAIALKPSDDGKATIVRLFGASGQDREAHLHWSAPQRRLSISDLSEDPLRPVEGAIPVAGWDVVTLRSEPEAS